MDHKTEIGPAERAGMAVAAAVQRLRATHEGIADMFRSVDSRLSEVAPRWWSDEDGSVTGPVGVSLTNPREWIPRHAARLWRPTEGGGDSARLVGLVALTHHSERASDEPHEPWVFACAMRLNEKWNETWSTGGSNGFTTALLNISWKENEDGGDPKWIDVNGLEALDWSMLRGGAAKDGFVPKHVAGYRVPLTRIRSPHDVDLMLVQPLLALAEGAAIRPIVETVALRAAENSKHGTPQ